MSNKNIIELNKVTFSYHTKILDIKYLNVVKGEKVLFMAPVAAEKTTLLSLLCGTLNPDSGSIKFVDTELTLQRNKKDHFRGNHIGHIFQQFNLINYLSVKDNILLPTVINKKQYESANNEFSKIVKALGIDQLLNKNVTELKSVSNNKELWLPEHLLADLKLLLLMSLPRRLMKTIRINL